MVWCKSRVLVTPLQGWLLLPRVLLHLGVMMVYLVLARFAFQV